MKKYLLSMLIAMFAVVSFAQPLALKQKGVKQLKPIASSVQVAKPERTFKLSPVVKGLKAPAARHSFGKSNTKAQRRAEGEFTVEDLAGEYIDAQHLYDVDPETYKFIPSEPSRMSSNVSIEAGDGNQIKIYLWDNEHPITGTVDLENFTISIPANQILGNDETYGDITMRNAEAETDDEPFTGTIYANGIMIDQLWYGSVVYQGSNANYTGVIGSFLAFPNGTMTYTNSKNQEVSASVAIIQEEGSSTVSVYNFADYGVAIDIELASDKTFSIDYNQVAFVSSKQGKFSPYGLVGGKLNIISGKGTENTLKANTTWTWYSTKGYWHGEMQPFVIVSDNEFIYPEAETGELVTPPAGLATVDMPMKATLYTPSPASYNATVKVGWDDNNVYFQGIDKDLPEAWVKGTYDETTGKVKVPITFMGIKDGSSHFIAGYGGENPAELDMDYDATINSFSCPGTVLNYKGSTGSTYNYYYNGVIIGTVPTPTTPPEGLVTKEMPFKGTYVEDEKSEVSGTVKVGRDGNDVYIQGLFASLVPADNEGWIKGTAQTIEGKELIIFSANQYVGNLSNSLAAYLTGYVPAQEEGGSPSAGNVVMAYVNDGTYEYYELGYPMILTRMRNTLNYEGYYTTLTIGNAPAAGINSIKSVKAAGDGAWYTIGGQRVAQPTQKGLYIHNGKKIVIK